MSEEIKIMNNCLRVIALFLNKEGEGIKLLSYDGDTASNNPIILPDKTNTLEFSLNTDKKPTGKVNLPNITDFQISLRK